MTDQELKNNIMRQIYVIFFLRKLVSPFAVKIFALTLLFISANFLVSIKDVLMNMPNMRHLGAVYQFYFSAFLSTEFSVKFLIIGALFLGIFIAKDIIFGLRKSNLKFGF